MTSLRFGQEGLVYVVGIQGNLIAFQDTSRILQGQNLRHLKEVDEFIQSQGLFNTGGGDISTGINDTSVVATYAALGTPDWAVVVELPVNEAYQRVIVELGLTVGAVLIIAIPAAWLRRCASSRTQPPVLPKVNWSTRLRLKARSRFADWLALSTV